jgi:hypothetical protein
MTVQAAPGPLRTKVMTDVETTPDGDAAGSRLASVDLGSALDAFGDASLLAAGKVNLIALDAIVDRLGARWPLRRDQVLEHADRAIARRLQSNGYHVRVSETDFLICQPDVGRFSGQAACLQILREILTHFIGDGAQADYGVLQVTKVSASEIQGSRVRVSEVEEGERREREEAPPPARAIERWTPFVAGDGRELSVTCELAPVYELRSFGRIGYRMVREVRVVGSGERLNAAMVRALSPGDILRIDLATVAHGINRLMEAQGDSRQPSLIVPVSFSSLSSQRGRMEIARLLMDVRAHVERGVICQIGDIDGVPEASLLQVVALIRPYCLLVIAHLDGVTGATGFSRLKRSGLQGLSVDCPSAPNETVLLRWMTATIQGARQVVRSTLLYGVTSPRHAAFAAQLGATHVSLDQ